LTLYGYLTLPPPVREGNQLPLVLMPHGGPHGPRDYWGFDPYVQVLATHGFAVLQVNFRGSGGYGPHFEKLGFREWPGNMQNDLTDSVAWAVKEGIADPRRICIYGWSYGGYAALMSAVKEPDLYACSVPAAGVYDLDIQYEESDFTRYTTWGKKYLDRVIGPTEADRRTASPISYLDKLKTPLFIVHGEADERVPVENARELKAALEKRGTKFEYMEKKHEGHGFFKEENRTAFFIALLDFLDRHIGAPPGQGDTRAGG
jgi:dipeptidyl aminopeptidase/acylaminoacyl peptidase